MQRLLEFTQHHPYLIVAAAAIILLLLGDELLRWLRKDREVTPAEGVLLINRGAQVVDVRPPQEFAGGHVIGSRNIPVGELDARAAELEKFKGHALLVCCQSGQTSRGAAGILGRHGFTQVHSLKGGINAWKSEQFPLERE